MTERYFAISFQVYMCIILLMGVLAGCGTGKNQEEPEVLPLAEGPIYEFEIIAVPNATNSLTESGAIIAL